ncbi:MAG: ABC transporter permease [Burkholderiales bacterium]
MSAVTTPVIPTPSRPRGMLALPAVVIVSFFLLAPLALILRYSLDKYDPTELMLGVVTVENYIKLFGDPFYQNVLLVTARIALISTCVTILLSFPVAYCISRAESERWRSRMIILVVLPLLLGNAVRSAAWMVVMGTKGVVNSTLLWLGMIGEPLTILYTPTAVVIALVSVLLPYAIITMQSVMDSIPRSLEEAAQSLGYSPARTIAQIVLPLAMPGLIAAGAICFALAMNAYATPVLIGGPKMQMMGPLVYEQIAKVSNWPFGSALACLLMASTILLTILSTRFLQKKYN